MIETKKVRLLYNIDNYINDLEAFGWKKTEKIVERYSRKTHHYQIMARDTNIDHYNELKKLENDYEKTKNQIMYYESMDFTIVLILLLLLVIPGVIYIAYKTSQKKSINANNERCNSIMRKIVLEARKIK